MAKITKDTLIADCLQINPNAPEILLSAGMHCFGCAMAHGETVAEAVAVHGEDLDALLAKLNDLNATRALIVTDAVDENLYLAARNIPHVDVVDAAAIDPVSLIAFDKVVMSVAAAKKIEVELG